MQIEAEHGFPEWSDPMEISVLFDLDLPDTGGGIYITLYGITVYIGVSPTLSHISQFTFSILK